MIGVGAFGRLTLEALIASPAVRVVGLSDKDPGCAERTGRDFDLLYYSDNRSLLAECRPSAVFVATPPPAVPELLAACADRGIHVWKDLPLARNLPEGVAMVERMERAGLKLAVGTQRRFSAAYRRMARLRSSLRGVFLARAHYLFNWGSPLGWRGALSDGGGALLEMGYSLVDLLVWLMGLPDEVYGITTGGQRWLPPDAGDTAAGPIYETDDSATALLRYADGCVATVMASRRAGPVSELLALHGRGGSMIADADGGSLRDPDGQVLEAWSAEKTPQAAFVHQVEAFAEAVRRNRRTYECSGRENLLNLAVIDAIYLSSRTRQPESPLRLLESANLTEATCLTLRPPAVSPQAIAPEAI